MNQPGPRERAEAAFGHVQQAAQEMIAAAHDTLDIIEQVVTTAGLGDLLDTVTHLSHSMLKWPRPAGPRQGTEAPAPPRSDSPVERIPVR